MTFSPIRTRYLAEQGSPWAWSRTSLLISAVLAITSAAAHHPAMAESTDAMLRPTPLVLKDGRIAEVSVHTIPFPSDAVAPSSKTSRTLDRLTETIATDCFLTAQVIGHVAKPEISGRETADIHRLARERADTIQASLIENGLPAASIASVWDWRFMVQEPRVTLWVFRLSAGDDCEDIPIGVRTSEQVAEASPVLAPPEEETPVASRQADVEHHIIPAAKPKSPELTAPLPKAPTTAEATKPATASSEVAEKTPSSAIAALAEMTSERPSATAESPSQLVDAAALDIIFATNSSYFPSGAGDQLRAFMNRLDENQSYVLDIQTSVDGDASVSGATSADEAQRYNSWLAERRFKRVETWLLNNADGRQLELRPSLIEHDGSRRVRIEARPHG